MYFLRRAHQLYKMKPVKHLSPSFWDSEGLAATDEGLDAIVSGIEHPLGRPSFVQPISITLTAYVRSIAVYHWGCGRSGATFRRASARIVYAIPNVPTGSQWRHRTQNA